jgi:hypothetical protein
MVAMNEISVERRTIAIDSPSTPTKYSMLKLLIQTLCSANCTAVWVPSKRAQSTSEKRKERPLEIRASRRDPWSTAAWVIPSAERRPSRRRMKTAPASGAKMMQVSR